MRIVSPLSHTSVSWLLIIQGWLMKPLIGVKSYNKHWLRGYWFRFTNSVYQKRLLICETSPENCRMLYWKDLSGSVCCKCVGCQNWLVATIRCKSTVSIPQQKQGVSLFMSWLRFRDRGHSHSSCSTWEAVSLKRLLQKLVGWMQRGTSWWTGNLYSLT